MSSFLPSSWRRWPLAVALCSAPFLLHCGSSDDDGGLGEGGTSGDASPPPLDAEDDYLALPKSEEDEGNRSLNPLCGDGLCLPDADAVGACQIAAGGAGGAGPVSFAGFGGGVSFDPDGLGSGDGSCQVVPTEEGTLERMCRPAGGGMEGQPCGAGKDCGPGLACVGGEESGICRPYCCAGTEASCSPDTFCDERPLLDAPELYVPVCLPVENCSLSEPFPCDGEGCSCRDELACVVVRSDGSTACTVPGSGQLGDDCTGTETAECAHGFVCSPNNGCMQICSTVAEDSGCPEGGTCQAISQLSQGLGLCIGVGSGTSSAR